MHACDARVHGDKCWRTGDRNKSLRVFPSVCAKSKDWCVSSQLLRLISWVFVSVSQALRENTYPFLAMIMLKDRRMTVVGRLEGLIQPDDLINQLTFIMDANQTYLVSERLERYWRCVLGKRTDLGLHRLLSCVLGTLKAFASCWRIAWAGRWWRHTP